MISEESKNELIAYGGEAFATVVEAVLGDSIAISKIPKLITTAPFFISNSVFMMKYEKILNGIYTPSADAVAISSKLFGEDNKERVDNAIRAISIIEKIDTLTKIEYLLNANRSFSNGCISREQLFRIANALVSALSEDLEYLKLHATDRELVGNTNIHSLANIGAVILAGIDANASVERQIYVVTEFGQIMDQYALSVMDDERQKFYHRQGHDEHTFDTGVEAIPIEEIEIIASDAAEEARPKWETF